MLFSFLILCIKPTFAQDLKYAKKTIKILSSKKFYGRGYVKDGDYNTALFIRNELKKANIKPLVTNYFQEYSFSVNIFEKTQIQIDNKNLIPGDDFCIRPYSPSISGTFDIIKLDTGLLKSNLPETLKAVLANKIGIYDTAGWGNKWYNYFYRSKSTLPYKGTIQRIDKTPNFGVSTRPSNNIAIVINRKAISENAQKITLEIKSHIEIHKTNNVIGTIPGIVDTFIVFTAHYDHLGGMGETAFFPGANDNASGTAMVLDIARELSKQKNQKYGFIFILFSGEEAGLLGSNYYTANPALPLEKIKIVFNLDMVGTGADGLSIYNRSNHSKEFLLLDSINRTLSLQLKPEWKKMSANTDLYPFFKKGVPGVTLLTDDKNAPYHTTTDTFNKLTFASYVNVIRLIKEYIHIL